MGQRKTKDRAVLPRYEDDECRIFLDWARLVTYLDEPLYERIVKIPNERDRSGVRAAILTALGLKKGFPDYAVLVPLPPCPGLFLEAKRPGGKIPLEQIRWRDQLRRWGYEAEICGSGVAMIEATRAYFRAHLIDQTKFVDRVKL